jgi:hypothetical protein
MLRGETAVSDRVSMPEATAQKEILLLRMRRGGGMESRQAIARLPVLRHDFGKASGSATVRAIRQSQRDCVSQPRVAKLPWVTVQKTSSTATRLRLFRSHSPRDTCAATPLGLLALFWASQGSSFLATLGFGTESLWDSGQTHNEFLCCVRRRFDRLF